MCVCEGYLRESSRLSGPSLPDISVSLPLRTALFPPQASASRTKVPTSPEADARISLSLSNRRLGWAFQQQLLGCGILEKPLQSCLSWGLTTTGSASVKVCRTPKTSPVLQEEQPMEAAAETPPTPPPPATGTQVSCLPPTWHAWPRREESGGWLQGL